MLDVTLRCSVYSSFLKKNFMCAKHYGSMGLFRVQSVSDMALLKLWFINYNLVLSLCSFTNIYIIYLNTCRLLFYFFVQDTMGLFSVQSVTWHYWNCDLLINYNLVLSLYSFTNIQIMYQIDHYFHSWTFSWSWIISPHLSLYYFTSFKLYYFTALNCALFHQFSHYFISFIIILFHQP